MEIRNVVVCENKFFLATSLLFELFKNSARNFLVTRVIFGGTHISDSVSCTLCTLIVVLFINKIIVHLSEINYIVFCVSESVF